MRRIVGHYEFLEKLGEGGMGVVYKARDLRLGRLVAIKVLAPGRLAEVSHRDRLVREAKIASALNHPNIVTIHDIESDGGVEFIAMEYVDGQPLSKLIPPEGLPVEQALKYALQIADGVGRAHAAGVVHRDLKPGNIMVNGHGLLKILDFGLAIRDSHMTNGDSLTATRSASEVGLVIGTVAYMSPEQALAEHVDARSDIFSFAAMLYEMLCGEQPFCGKNALSTLRKIQIEPPTSLHKKRPVIPARVDEIVTKALSKEPSERYQSMNDMAVDLRAVLADISAESQRVPNRRIRPRWMAAAALSLVSALIIATQVSSVRTWLTPANASNIATPTNAFEWVKQGRTYIQRYDQTGNIDRAIAAYQNAIRLEPNNAPAHAALAEAYFRKDSITPDPQWKRLAAESAHKSVALNSDLAVAHLALGMVLLRTGKANEAEHELRRTLELDPLNASAFLWLAEYYADKQDSKTAEEFYAKATQRAPGDWIIYQYVGRFRYRNSQFEDAAAAWERAKELAPDNILILRSLSAAYHALDRDDEVWALLQRSLEIAPSATAYSNMGTYRFFAGQYAEAAAAFEKAVEMNPTDYLYWGNLGDAYRWVPGDEAKAKDAFARATQLAQEKLSSRKDDSELASSLAVYLAKGGQRTDAVNQIEQLEKFPKRTTGSYFKSLVAYEILGNREKALRDLNSTLHGGYPLKEITNEPELASLRTDKRYHTAITQVRESKQSKK